MSQSFQGQASKMKEMTALKISRVLGVDLKELDRPEAEVFNNIALVLSVIPGFSKWTNEEKELMVEIFRAKAGGSEATYLQLMQKHGNFRKGLIGMGRPTTNHASHL
jgi:hypothetical protein